MVLSFADAGKNQRKWQCFVCGQNYESYEEYNKHIIEKHEEGREYIKCPVCEAGVRCLTSHFRIKHPNRIMPKGVQTKVTVWRDFSSDGKKKKVRKISARKGVFVSEKCNAEFLYRSNFECDFYDLVEQDNTIENWAAEPFKIPYFWQGKWKSYIPDLRINFIDGSTEIWEIKPANQTCYEQNQKKWEAATNYCNNIGYEFVVLTEIGFSKLKQKVKLQEETNHG